MLDRKSKNLLCSLLFLVFFIALLGVEIWVVELEAADVPDGKILKFAAWNIQKLGYARSHDRSCLEEQQIADILNEYHLIAITELMHKEMLKPVLGKDGRIIKWKNEKLMMLKDRKFQELKKNKGKILSFKDADFIELKYEGNPKWDFEKVLKKLSDMGRNYSCLISPKVGDENPEHYALLYDEELVCEVKVGGLIRGNELVKKFERVPYWATFRAGNFDFSVIVVHTKPDNAKKECELMDEVYKQVQKKNGKDEDDILLVGDFNLQPNNTAFDDLKKVDSEKTVDPLILPPKKTNIADTRLYDNIFLQRCYLEEYNEKSDVYYFDEVVFGGNDDQAGGISDHRPVWAEFEIDLEDDDGAKLGGDAGDSESQ